MRFLFNCVVAALVSNWNEDSHFSDGDDDHATEWVNEIGTSARGISGITQTPSALLR